MDDVSAEEFAQAFEKFMAHTDQADVFAVELGRDIDSYRPRSLLDVGAGNGSLAVRLSRQVERYLAVERNPRHATHLRGCGVEVVEESFPVALPDLYDLVLMSYVISYEERDCRTLVPAAWKQVAPGGRLLVVVHRVGSGSDWGRLLSGIGMDGSVGLERRSFDEMMTMLRSMGTVEVREVTTTVTTDSVLDMTEMLAFVVPHGHREEFMGNGAQLARVLEDGYRTGSGLSFPFQNVFVSVGKPCAA
jgi:SAM-dependent methyltransferase